MIYIASAPCPAQKHLGFVAEGAHIAMYAEAGRMGDLQPLVLPSLKEACGPRAEVENTAHFL